MAVTKLHRVGGHELAGFDVLIRLVTFDQRGISLLVVLVVVLFVLLVLFLLGLLVLWASLLLTSFSVDDDGLNEWCQLLWMVDILLLVVVLRRLVLLLLSISVLL